MLSPCFLIIYKDTKELEDKAFPTQSLLFSHCKQQSISFLSLIAQPHTQLGYFQEFIFI